MFRSIVIFIGEVEVVYLYFFVDVSILVCCVVVVVIVDYEGGVVKGFFILKFRILKRNILIVRLEFVSGYMVVNMVKNFCIVF